jgi:RNA polymerase sigma-70 factor (ECF subfamily)
MEAHDEQTLLERARRGDRRALDTLLTQLEPSVYKFGLKMCRDDETAREVLQETLLTTVRHLSAFRGDSSLTTWLYTVARSVCIKQRRKSKFAPAVLEPLEAAAEAEASTTASGIQVERPDHSFERAELAARLEQAIAALEPMYRDVLVLRDVEGLSAAEVAEALDLTVEAVKSRLHRARARVREALAPALAPMAPPGPTCPDVAAMLSAKLEGDIAPETCQEMEQHLAGCPACTAICDSLRETLRMCGAVRRQVPPELQNNVRRAVQEFLQLHAE